MRWVEQRLMMRALVVVVACCLGVVACTRPNPAYCASPDDCGAGKSCDLTTHTCVAASDMPDAGAVCSTNQECSATTPVCGSDGACRACELDDECASGVCANDGSCELPERVIYVAPNGPAAGACEQSTPCDIYYAKGMTTPERYTMRLANGSYTMTADFIIDGAIQKLVIVGGRSAILQRASAGPVLVVQFSELHVRGFTFNKGVRCMSSDMTATRVVFENPPPEARPWIETSSCAIDVKSSELRGSTGAGISGGSVLNIADSRITNSASHGIYAAVSANIKRCHVKENGGIGIYSVGGGLTVDSCLIVQNAGGGVKNNGAAFSITNNMLRHNGDAGSSPFGGMDLVSQFANNRLQHNTVIDNFCDVNYTPIRSGGVYCAATALVGNNLIGANQRGNFMYPNAQVGGTCDFSSSMIFEYQPAEFASDYLHLAAGNAAINAGTPSNITIDIDGDPRSDGMPDVGADELVP